MNVPHGFIEASAAGPGEVTSIFISVGEIAAIKEAGQFGGTTETLIVLKSGETLQLATPFSSIIERLSGPEEDAE